MKEIFRNTLRYSSRLNPKPFISDISQSISAAIETVIYKSLLINKSLISAVLVAVLSHGRRDRKVRSGESPLESQTLSKRPGLLISPSSDLKLKPNSNCQEYRDRTR